MRARHIAVLGVTLVLALGSGASESPAPRTIVINEVELNPDGFDRDAEWVEILNVSAQSVDMTGWSLTYNYPSDGLQPLSETAISLAPGARLIIGYAGLRLRNDESTAIALVNAAGETVDATGVLRDTKDDATTWQRFPDGGDPLFPDLWLFLPGTPNRTND
ncbi:MAG: lamin tail domain-containing protein [Candidatus Bipolaricaulota bacterium]